tara:strand:- start:637 stop:954 length:318 start_codon:yes stop_codon:yes gene_type:complete
MKKRPHLGNGNINYENKRMVASAWLNSAKKQNAEIAMPIVMKIHKMMMEHNITVSVRLSDTNHSESYNDHTLIASFNLFANQLPGMEEPAQPLEEDKFDASRFSE